MFVPISSELNENAEDEYMINAALAAGLYPKILIAEGGNGLKTLGNNQAISIVRDVVTQVATGTDAFALTASKLHQFQDKGSRLWGESPGILYHHAITQGRFNAQSSSYGH